MNLIEILLEDPGLERLSRKESKKIERYTRAFLQLKNLLIPFPKLSFLSYQEATLDLSEPGQLPGILHNRFKIGFPVYVHGKLKSSDELLPHIHYKKNNMVSRIKRPDLVGRIY